MQDAQALTALFREKAELVSAKVSAVEDLAAALAYVVDICAKKEACQLLLSGCGEPLSDPAAGLCATAAEKTIAAPGLEPGLLGQLTALAGEAGIAVVSGDMRRHLAGVDLGFTIADWGIAETGTLVLRSRDEDLRLATMVCEVHVAVLPLSRLRATALDLAPVLAELMAEAPSYTAFITGASRTADIERVLALGVHGPLELHILLWEDE